VPIYRYRVEEASKENKYQEDLEVYGYMWFSKAKQTKNDAGSGEVTAKTPTEKYDGLISTGIFLCNTPLPPSLTSNNLVFLSFMEAAVLARGSAELGKEKERAAVRLAFEATHRASQSALGLKNAELAAATLDSAIAFAANFEVDREILDRATAERAKITAVPLRC
jgi:hypothetical protein